VIRAVRRSGPGAVTATGSTRVVRGSRVSCKRCDVQSDLVYFSMPPGELVSCRRPWTDLVAPDPFVVVAAAGPHFAPGHG